MAPARTLQEIFAGLAGGTGEAAEVLRESGHGDLPGELVAEAIASYAGTAPAEVAEHLAPFVMGHSPVPLGETSTAPAADGLALVATAPMMPADGDTPVDRPADAGPGADQEAAGGVLDLAFGEGGVGGGTEIVESFDPGMAPAEVAVDTPEEPADMAEPLPEDFGAGSADLPPAPAAEPDEPDEPGGIHGG